MSVSLYWDDVTGGDISSLEEGYPFILGLCVYEREREAFMDENNIKERMSFHTQHNQMIIPEGKLVSHNVRLTFLGMFFGRKAPSFWTFICKAFVLVRVEGAPNWGTVIGKRDGQERDKNISSTDIS